MSYDLIRPPLLVGIQLQVFLEVNVKNEREKNFNVDQAILNGVLLRRRILIENQG